MVEKWGKYTLNRLLARGGMAEIFEARNIGPSDFVKQVCLKRIRVEYSNNSEFVEMFQSEARIAATLHHPNIVQVFDFDRHDQQLFLAMEYVEGLDLKQIITRASSLHLRVPVPFAVHVTQGLLMALIHAHGQTLNGDPRPVIHRDVSPHNVLVSDEGVVKLVDFGIAKAEGLSDVTREGVIKGKLAYLSPEQARGESAGPGADVFGVGLVLWEMLAGRRLNKGNDNKEHIAALLNLKVPSIEGLSGALNAYVRRLLEPDQSDRFESAQAALDHLGETGVAPCTTKVAGELVKKLQHLADDPMPSVSHRESLEKKGETQLAPDIPATEVLSRPDPEPEMLSRPVADPGRGRLTPIAVVAAFILGCVSVFMIFNMGGASRQDTGEMDVVRAGPRPVPAVGPPEVPEESIVQSRELPERGSPIVHLKEFSDTGGEEESVEEAVTDEVKPGRSTSRMSANTGFIEINVRPWARVKVDGHDEGVTPVKKLKVKAGNHRVVLVNEEWDYKKSFKVHVRSGKTAVLNEMITGTKNRSPN